MECKIDVLFVDSLAFLVRSCREYTQIDEYGNDLAAEGSYRARGSGVKDPVSGRWKQTKTPMQKRTEDLARVRVFRAQQLFQALAQHVHARPVRLKQLQQPWQGYRAQERSPRLGGCRQRRKVGQHRPFLSGHGDPALRVHLMRVSFARERV